MIFPAAQAWVNIGNFGHFPRIIGSGSVRWEGTARRWQCSADESMRRTLEHCAAQIRSVTSLRLIAGTSTACVTPSRNFISSPIHGFPQITAQIFNLFWRQPFRQVVPFFGGWSCGWFGGTRHVGGITVSQWAVKSRSAACCIQRYELYWYRRLPKWDGGEDQGNVSTRSACGETRKTGHFFHSLSRSILHRPNCIAVPRKYSLARELRQKITKLQRFFIDRSIVHAQEYQR